MDRCGRGRVVGVRGQTKDGGSFSERTRVVIGADGRYSLVAKAVAAPKYDEQPTLSCGYYTYWADVPIQGGEIYRVGRRMLGAWPTNDGLTIQGLLIKQGDPLMMRSMGNVTQIIPVSKVGGRRRMQESLMMSAAPAAH
jgi:2-polyprenyl-6-methoxyphenol hydroxylase-like FAD-dependent oxidoreductase